MSNQHYYHFTLGPVQAFVAQARRTRDFWAGSFILSWLSSVAIKAVEAQGGEVQFPSPKSDYMAWLCGKGEGTPPQQGAIPNRFKAISAQVDSNFDPKQICNSVNQAWQAMAMQIWEEDIASLEQLLGEELLKQCKIIWDRQVNGFWEMNWVLSDDANASNLLDQRKNWRSHVSPDEPGVKCMLMDGWQELSGLSTPSSQGLTNFWETLRNGTGKAITTDIREGEYLCALAFIKRRFSRYFSELCLPMPGDWTLKGWSLPHAVPSLAHIAAGRWLEKCFAKVNDSGNRDLLDQYYHAINEALLDIGSERDSLLPSVKSACDLHDVDPTLAGIDGSLWFDFLLNQQNNQIKLVNQPALEKAKRALTTLQRQSAIGSPHPYYAVLLMDGDSLGTQMGDTGKQEGISAALNRFTSEAANIVKQHNGFLIYAGGDDVLALLGVSDAIPCAQALRLYYKACFDEQNRQHNTNIITTLSGAINIGHIKWPLRSLIFDAHHLLDDIAKEQTGRDALAIKVWKRDKPHLCWSAPWSVLFDEQGNRFERLLNAFANGAISNSFIFKLRKLIIELRLDGEHPLTEEAMVTLIRAEYLHSQAGDELKNTPPEWWFCELVQLCKQYRRTTDGDHFTVSSYNRLNVDGALLLRFLQTAYHTAGALTQPTTGESV
ncbi:type III-B CRISPR-associated protein Cas10/Cmr2 [uncultured Shewanella sp.]|uniref:type III-B CRISPR-associated protein Cas10/Cmr2 n=1 Tax=uncultured Shewanella sp. TaxID=173975 RepID=UPI00260DF71C|nr:type III-B CRISPR-associated protein Cas10/Cmr2 [uncultured Shewanella sp.]